MSEASSFSTQSMLSRRSFVAAAGGAMVAGSTLGRALADGGLTAGEVVQRIQKNVGVPWFPKTVDNLLTGTADTPVKGIATTMMATLDVMERAVAQGLNMIVTHETPFYLHQDSTDDIGNFKIREDGVFQAKMDFCRRNSVCLFHFHDHWHARHPDGIAQGMVNQLGWQKNVNDPADPKKLTFDGVPLAKFAQQMAATLHARTMRVMGDPALPIRHVQTSWGYISREPGIQIFSQPGLDLFICGETREWELVEYCQDSIHSGNKKALIVVGHVLSEQGGMMLCAEWLRPMVPEVPVKFVAATEPFWSPEKPVLA